MPGKPRPAPADAEESSVKPPEPEVDAAVEAKADPEPAADAGAEPQAGQKPGLYRFTWPYACTYNLPGQVSKEVEPGAEVFWPSGAPDALWEFVSDAPAPSDNT